MSNENTKTESQKNAVPAYVQFTAALRARLDQAGVKYETAATETGLPQNAGYAFLRVDGGEGAVIIPKSKTKMARLDCHVDASGLEGYVPLTKPNGRVVCHFEPDVGLLVDGLLARLSGAPKRPVVKPVKKTPGATPGQVMATIETPVRTAMDDFDPTTLGAAQLSNGESELRDAEIALELQALSARYE